MTEFTGRADIALDVSNFLALSFEELERGGERMIEYFAPDCVYDAKVLRLSGHEELRAYFAKRRATITSVGRHLLSNLHFDFAAWEERREVTVRAVMTHFGAVGSGVLPAGPPMGVYDVVMRVRTGGAFGWLFLQQVYEPIFMAQDDASKRYMVNKDTSSSATN